MENEIDIALIKQFRLDGAIDQEILDVLVSDGGGQLGVNSDVLDLQAAIDAGVNPSDLLNYITSGKTISTRIDSSAEAALAGAGTGMVNLLGLPVDIMNSAQQGLEGAARKGINYVAGTELSTNPEDYLFSSTKPVLGSESIKTGIETVANPVEDFLGLPKTEYLDREEIPEEYRGAYTAGRVVGENAIPAAATLKAAKAGFGLSNPIMQSIRNNSKKFVAGEAAATTGAATAAATAENLDLGDNPYAMAGAEILGAIVGGNAKTIASLTPMNIAYQGVKSLGGRVLQGMSSDAARMGAYEQILQAADAARQSLLKQADIAAKDGDIELEDALRAEADMYTVERMQADIETALALGENTPAAVGRMSAGNLTNNPVLQAMQRDMMGQSPQFSQDVMNSANEAIMGILEVSELLARAGNTAAAEALRTRAYSASIDATLANATGNVADAMKAVMGADKSAASILAQKTLFQAKTNIRDMETFLWERIDGSQMVSGDAISEIIDKIYNEKLLDGMTIAGGGQIDEAINAINQKIKSGQGIPASDVLKFRSIMLSNSRKAGAADDFFQAGLFDELAGAGIDELNKLEGVAGDTVKMAREFSLQLNKRFTRYFTKDALATEKLGGTSIRDSELLEAGFGSGGDAASNQFNDLQSAAEFPDQVGSGVNAIKEQELQREFDKFSRGIGREPNTIVMPQELSGPKGTNVSTDVKADTQRMDQRDIPGAGERSVNQQTADDLYAFAKEMDRQGKPELAKIATERAQKFDTYRGPSGEEYFDPKAAAPEAEIVDDFKLNEGGDTTSVTIPDEVNTLSLGEEMSSAQEEFLRGKVRELAGIENVITPEALETFMANNQKLVAEFPNLREDIVSLHDAQRTADRLVDDLKLASNNEKLPEAIGQALATNTPEETFSKLAKEAITPDAKIDFRNATMDELFRGAVKADGSPDMLKIADSLLKPISGRQGDINILDVMVKNGILEPNEMQAIVNLVSEGLVIEKGIRDPKIFDQAIAATPDIQKNIARLAGANAGVLFGSGQASLQAAAIGSAFFKKYVDQFPIAKQSEELQKLLRQPKLLAAMLSENPLIRKSGFQAAKEYGSALRELGIGGASRQIASTVAGKAADRLSTMRTAYPSAVTGNQQDERNPKVLSLDIPLDPNAYDPEVDAQMGSILGAGSPR